MIPKEETNLLLEESKRTIKELKERIEELSISRSNGESIAGKDLKISQIIEDALKTLEASSPRAPSRQNSLELITSPQKEHPPVDNTKEEEKISGRKLQRKLSTFQKRTQSLGYIPKMGERSPTKEEESTSRILLQQKKNTIQYLSTRLSTSGLQCRDVMTVIESIRVREEKLKEEADITPKSKEQALNDLNKRLDSSKDKLKKIRYQRNSPILKWKVPIVASV